MEIILKQDIEKLGYKDDVVKVKNGYARNFLVPKGLAVVASASAKKMHEETLRQRAHKLEKEKQAAVALVEQIKAATIKVGAKVGENGKIFGSVTNVQLADAITKLGFEVERRHIKITGEGIKAVGTYEAEVRLHKEVADTISFEVIAD